jgi:hypothetical protein
MKFRIFLKPNSLATIGEFLVELDSAESRPWEKASVLVGCFSSFVGVLRLQMQRSCFAASGLVLFVTGNSSSDSGPNDRSQVEGNALDQLRHKFSARWTLPDCTPTI